MGPMSRREFVRHSAALSAAVAASTGGVALGKEALPEARKPDATKTLRVAVIGVNSRGMAHVDGFAGRHNCEIVTICDCDEAVVGKAISTVEKRQNGKAPKFEKDLRRVMDDKSIDIVSIATPNHWHALAAIWAMQAGKDVYVEKPVSHNVWEGRRIVDIARATGMICQTGTQIRSTGALNDAVKFLQSGGLGKVRLARGLCYKPRRSIGDIGRKKGAQPTPKSLDYDLWCGPAPKSPLMRAKLHYDWHWVYETGNGDLGNQGIHQMDVARWGLGKNQLANSVWSIGGRFGYVDDGETANTQIAHFDYGDSSLIFEVRGLNTADWLADTRKQPTADGKMRATVGNVFYGEKGYLIVGGYESAVAVTPDWEVIKVFSKGGDHFGNFVNAVRKRDHKLLNADILEGHLSSALCHLANISLLNGTPAPLASEVKDLTDNADVRETLTRFKTHLTENKVDLASTTALVGPKLVLNPETETFLNAPAKATQMLRREYRKGFEVPTQNS
ncbi:Gfo/Idh/MocA family protein [Tuwongella immobilis]|uniref:Gfo/Idh/MocA-like oxidoreductase N-terminal domain-containing protein n=1 Tax=Tuwongella immobilis TaxID=692036 RepID=A0A6C2YNQ0_9BACT|nr:Gfo/Idh/MocA family oxidoreductase [Tuwongella immobilis]VIP02512.1 nadh-dependent dehydrogenase : Probable NADH-dependent dyhydrogenase-putative NAD-employing oxidorecutase of the GFO family protein OS=Planctomyces maris DSM 8797 GN=PM8797T_25366 PE=4 SV=1: GFO_IDH_MocA [Tuwongella immobilis]VTS01625.1 nadh-dependent dehydrogenase : Probable NADH-dependent dyhydrogenase-putative NAD-employing oxidorecutase of the GFO family protein OS=Planctomyces maris DSM 8797 GN=PM8797T_25366 PE=4 SV=1: GF